MCLMRQARLTQAARCERLHAVIALRPQFGTIAFDPPHIDGALYWGLLDDVGYLFVAARQARIRKWLEMKNDN